MRAQNLAAENKNTAPAQLSEMQHLLVGIAVIGLTTLALFWH